MTGGGGVQVSGMVEHTGQKQQQQQLPTARPIAHGPVASATRDAVDGRHIRVLAQNKVHLLIPGHVGAGYPRSGSAFSLYHRPMVTGERDRATGDNNGAQGSRTGRDRNSVNSINTLPYHQPPSPSIFLCMPLLSWVRICRLA